MMCTENHDVVCAQTKTSARHAYVFLTGEVTGKNVIGTVKVKTKKDQSLTLFVS